MLAAGPAAASLQADRLRDIAPAVEEEIQAGRIPGAVVVVGQGSDIVYRRAFGERALVPRREAMTLDTIFDLASLTKVVATTTAILQLRQRGLIGLDEPVARYWPQFGRRGKAGITVRDLLTHRSGLRADLDLSTDWHGYRTAMARILDESPRTRPGARVLYSDINFEVLGELVRRVSGLPLDRYCERYVFEPLGMGETSFHPHDAADVAPTVFRRGAMLRGEVHDPTAWRMGGVAGHAGLFSTADDLARFARLLATGGGTNVLDHESVAAMMQTSMLGSASRERGLGWELVPVGGALEPARALRHTGYTGTMLWIDPDSQAYLVLLTNRVHPSGRGDAGPLRRKVVALVERALSEAPKVAAVKTGIDVLAESGFAPLRGLRVGLITNRSGIDAAGRSTAETLRRAGVLAALFTPEHGLRADAEDPIASDNVAGLPVYSLYGATRRPTSEMLRGIDALVFDLQDAGVRFYTYISTLGYAMEEAARRGLPFFVLDRPDPIGAAEVQGPLLDADLRSFTGYFPLPVRYGMTIGELARMLNDEANIHADLTVVAMQRYRRADWYDDTGLAWVAPSPNLRSITSAALYPGVAIVEGANVSLGRGTDTPFELVGAPWIDGERLAARLNARAIAGVHFHAVSFVPAAAPYEGKRCTGVRVELVDREALDSPRMGVEIAAALQSLYPGVFRLDAILGMIGSRSALEAIRNGEDPASIAHGWSAPLRAFMKTRSRYLIYPESRADSPG